MSDDVDIEVIETRALDRKQPWWLVALALGLAAVLGVLVVVVITRDPDSGPSSATGQLDCKSGRWMTVNVDYGEMPTGALAPAAAVADLASGSSVDFDPTDFEHGGSAADPENPGTVFFVRREGSRMTGRIRVTPIESGYVAGPIELCKE